MALSTEKKAEILKEYGLHETDHAHVDYAAIAEAAGIKHLQLDHTQRGVVEDEGLPDAVPRR